MKAFFHISNIFRSLLLFSSAFFTTAPLSLTEATFALPVGAAPLPVVGAIDVVIASGDVIGIEVVMAIEIVISIGEVMDISVVMDIGDVRAMDAVLRPD